MTEENGKTFTMQTPASVLAPKQQYLNLMMNSFYELGKLCTTNEQPSDIQAKTGMLTQMMVHFIPNPKERERLLNMRRDKRAEATKEIHKKNQGAAELREVYFAIDCEIVGEMMTLMDDVLAIVERQAIIKTVSSGSDLEKAFYPDGYEMQNINDATDGGENGA